MWTRIRMAALIMASICALSGCGPTHHGMRTSKHDWEMDPAKAVFFKELHTIESKLPPGHFKTTDQAKTYALAYTYKDKLASFTWLLGLESEAHFDRSISYLVLDDGWIYVWGVHPRARRGQVSAGAEGSGFAMWTGVRNGKQVVRAFFLNGHYGWYEHDSDHVEYQWGNKAQYAESIDDGKWQLTDILTGTEPDSQQKTAEVMELLAELIEPSGEYTGP